MLKKIYCTNFSVKYQYLPSYLYPTLNLVKNINIELFSFVINVGMTKNVFF